MNYYDEVYNKRLNRYGENFASRIQGQRVHDFQYYKTQSIYQVNFLYNKQNIDGVLEPNKQDESETTQWLLTDLNNILPNGTIIEINKTHWMVMYLKEAVARGYNKFLVLKMTHLITWKDREHIERESWCYFFGKMDRIIYDMIRSTAKNPNYMDPNKETHIIMPYTDFLKRQDYLEIDGEGYYVTGFDQSSTPGVEYFSLKETFLRNQEEAIIEDDSDSFWLGGSK